MALRSRLEVSTRPSSRMVGILTIVTVRDGSIVSRQRSWVSNFSTSNVPRSTSDSNLRSSDLSTRTMRITHTTPSLAIMSTRFDTGPPGLIGRCIRRPLEQHASANESLSTTSTDDESHLQEPTRPEITSTTLMSIPTSTQFHLELTRSPRATSRPTLSRPWPSLMVATTLHCRLVKSAMLKRTLLSMLKRLETSPRSRISNQFGNIKFTRSTKDRSENGTMTTTKSTFWSINQLRKSQVKRPKVCTLMNASLTWRPIETINIVIMRNGRLQSRRSWLSGWSRSHLMSKASWPNKRRLMIGQGSSLGRKTSSIQAIRTSISKIKSRST